jgi:DNA polymerase
MDSILNCKKCPLYKNQGPLLDIQKYCDVMWIGLSAKKTESLIDDNIPLSSTTKSGQLIEQIESCFKDVSTYKTNLVKCLPLDGQGKLRYPTKEEVSICVNHIKYEIELLKPRIVIMLGQQVTDAITKHFGISINKYIDFDYTYEKQNGVYFVSVQHPSYISVYKRQYISNYKSAISRLVHELI